MPDSLPQGLSLAFPGTTLRRNSTETEAVRAVQAALNARGCGPVDVDGVYGPQTEAAVRHFQSRFFDAKGLPLTVDGQVGPVTWAALFGSAALPAMKTGSALATATLKFAASQVGVMEDPPGSNRGKEVEQYLASVGVAPGNAWCAAFVYFCVEQAAQATGLANPLPKTGGVLDLWRRSLKAGLPASRPARPRRSPAASPAA